MGINARIYAVGVFSERAKPYLSGSIHSIGDDQVEGTPILSVVIDCECTSQSRALASALEINPFSIKETYITGEYLKDYIEALHDFADNYHYLKEDVYNMIQLADLEFDFFYRPE